MTNEQLMTNAVGLHSAGRVAEAEAIYRQILAANPSNVAALHMLGVALGQRGERDAAIQHISRAVALQPGVEEFHSNLAIIYLEKADPQKAADSARTAIALKPNQPRAMNLLGKALKVMGRIEESADVFKNALTVQPDSVPTMRNLADSYRRLGHDAEADSYLDRVLALRPTDLEALGGKAETLFRYGRLAESAELFKRIIAAHGGHWLGYHGLGVALFEQGRADEAIPLLEKSISLAPDRAGNYDSLGHAYTLAGRLDDAINCLKKAAALDPGFTSAHNNLGHALAVSGRIDEAIESLHRALELTPTSVSVHNNLGNAYCAKLDFDRGMAAYNAALCLQPDHADSHWNKAILLLQMGDYAHGWLEYEWRWLKFASQKRKFRQPLWAGSDIAGKTILLHPEQGFGDAIQFIRFAPLIVQRGGIVYLECFEELIPLLKDAPGVSKVFPIGKAPADFDWHCPLLSLPFALGIADPSAIPAPKAYLEANKDICRKWADTIAPYNQTFKVGIVWAGASYHARDRDRSIPPLALSGLSAISGVTFFNLQKGKKDHRLQPPADFKLVDFTDQLTDFAQTAGLIANLDLVISVDTSVAHLAGAMGKPVWTLIANYPDWRWLMNRDDTPWYPSMRLFRQPARGDWAGLLRRVSAELSVLARVR